MQEDKYYTPDIEDIRVGYEGEINWSRGYSKEFVPFKITVQNEDFAYTGLLSEIVDAMDDGYAEVKTPYLTKEQIEAEGWFNGVGENWFYKDLPNVVKQNNEYFLDGNLISFGDYELHYDFNTHKLLINNEDRCRFFYGNCPSINEFRMITKLLNIK